MSLDPVGSLLSLIGDQSTSETAGTADAVVGLISLSRPSLRSMRMTTTATPANSFPGVIQGRTIRCQLGRR